MPDFYKGTYLLETQKKKVKIFKNLLKNMLQKLKKIIKIKGRWGLLRKGIGHI